jgi:hypothetical protein
VVQFEGQGREDRADLGLTFHRNQPPVHYEANWMKGGRSMAIQAEGR